MANYDGVTEDTLMSVVPAWCFPHSTVQKHGGSYSIRLLPGRVYPPIWVACEAGSRTITCWVYPTVAANVLQMKVIDPDTLENMGETKNAGSESWEQLSVVFTATKKCYLVLIGNYTPAYVPGDLQAGYFDDFSVI